MVSQRTLDDLVSDLRPAFPPTADVTVFSSTSDVDVAASWLPGNDETRTRKRTKPLTIRVSDEAVLEYKRLSGSERSKAISRVVTILQATLQRTALHHDASPMGTAAGVTIVIPSRVMSPN